MDLYVENQCKQQLVSGSTKQFLLLFDASFPALYKYVARRVMDLKEVEKIVTLTFLDALGQAVSTPMEVSYAVWLYSLAKPRVWDYMGKTSLPEKRGLIAANQGFGDDETVRDDELVKTEKMMAKLSLEEREILRLKFFEEVSDSDVMVVIGMNEGAVGSKIYRVLKRAHFLLFGESDERQGVYFGELAGILSRVRDIELIEIPEAFKLSLRLDIENRIERRDFAIEAEEVKELSFKDGASHQEVAPKGSDDPAKIFVQAVKEMREDGELDSFLEQQRLEKQEAVYDFIDRWKRAIFVVPLVAFVAVFGVVSWQLVSGKVNLFAIERGYPTECKGELTFVGDFFDGERRTFDEAVTNPLCDKFQVKGFNIERGEYGKAEVTLSTSLWTMQYRFEKKEKEWRIKEYERALNSNEKSGEV